MSTPAAADRWTTGPDASGRCTETVLLQFGITGQRPEGVIGMLDALIAAGFRVRSASTGSQTVAEFCADRPSGRFYFGTDGHALALIDGLLVDSAGQGPDSRRVLGAFEVLTP